MHKAAQAMINEEGIPYGLYPMSILPMVVVDIYSQLLIFSRIFFLSTLMCGEFFPNSLYFIQ